ncbi:SDR family NAD(P)-dependent oxidoreductase [Cupriavidus agavae]|uniref:NAD(P)-dependent dehydrogenase (Short-subunit alcohol dehydrogenase family) n=1 Tax=Cupriavidus agavae TaxID=1001822 RepID=A0A4Q7R9T7_9BURK|nr:SDR family NAD(P)-dependent oxidoreductase [Cupriavidus agavae]RZT29097.1 NAD(P)-dependent dehydrogenase (short-subunit alcohol dehydrogenase family) [Cupriavidus agavae]
MPAACIILVTHAAEGVGPITVTALAHGGHTVYAALNCRRWRDRAQAQRLRDSAIEHGLDIRIVDMKPESSDSVSKAVGEIVHTSGQIDILVQGGVPSMVGPTEAFAPEQASKTLGRYLVGAQRTLRAVLPHMREAHAGLIIWVLGTAAGGGTAPYLGWYCAIQSGLEALAVQYARDLVPFGIESALVMSGMFGTLSSPFQRPELPADQTTSAAYSRRLGLQFQQRIQNAADELSCAEEIPGATAGAVAMIVETPAGQRPFRTIVDPVKDGADVVFLVLDRVRAEMMRRLGCGDLLDVCYRERRSDEGVTPETLRNAEANDDGV